MQGLRVAVLGSTSGIGRATALTLASAGCDVLVHGRSRERAERLVAALRQKGVRAEAVLADLSDPAKGDLLVERAWETWGCLDAWLHFAGADVLTGHGRKLGYDAKLDLLW